MYERFTERARDVVKYAHSEARNLNHNYIGTEHVLLGLLVDEDTLACRALAACGVEHQYVRADVLQIVGGGEGPPVGNLSLTPRAKSVMEQTLREALSCGHNYIGTEHILLALTREGKGVATQILDDHGATADAIRDAVFDQLGQARPAGAKPEPEAESERLLRLIRRIDDHREQLGSIAGEMPRPTGRSVREASAALWRARKDLEQRVGEALVLERVGEAA